MATRLIQVIEAESLRGTGASDNPWYVITQYFTPDGELLAEERKSKIPPIALDPCPPAPSGPPQSQTDACICITHIQDLILGRITPKDLEGCGYTHHSQNSATVQEVVELLEKIKELKRLVAEQTQHCLELQDQVRDLRSLVNKLKFPGGCPTT